jgi:hypothetical protein
MKWAVVFAIIAVMLSACQRPMTWDEMHGWGKYQQEWKLQPYRHEFPASPWSVPDHTQPLVKTRDC